MLFLLYFCIIIYNCNIMNSIKNSNNSNDDKGVDIPVIPTPDTSTPYNPKRNVGRSGKLKRK